MDNITRVMRRASIGDLLWTLGLVFGPSFWVWVVWGMSVVHVCHRILDWIPGGFILRSLLDNIA